MNQNKVDAQARRAEEAARNMSTAKQAERINKDIGSRARSEGNAQGRPGRRLGEAIVDVKTRRRAVGCGMTFGEFWGGESF